MKIAEAAETCGLSVDTIRFYEKTGLSPEIPRGPDGQRRFSPACVEWLTLLALLRATGMPMREMKRFAALYEQGDVTVSDRKRVLLEHKARLKEREADIKSCAALLTRKLSIYDAMLGSET